ncbi:MAG: proline--tRNA ligase, partial [Bacteroidales bacterium]|nr:proline--tRNA ligase [Bacteroidales bacterium]
TRTIGALIMAHSDNHGLVLPPLLAPVQVVIIPIYKNVEQLQLISSFARKTKSALEENGISVKYDDRDTNKPGWKFADYELKGVPVRIAIGPRDIENNTMEIFRRDTLEKETIPASGITDHIKKLLDDIQGNIFRKASTFRNDNTYYLDKWDDFVDVIENKGGFIMAHWDGSRATEEKIKEETKATIRCIPFDSPDEEGKCIYSGKPSVRRVLFSRAY